MLRFLAGWPALAIVLTMLCWGLPSCRSRGPGGGRQAAQPFAEAGPAASAAAAPAASVSPAAGASESAGQDRPPGADSGPHPNVATEGPAGSRIAWSWAPDLREEIDRPFKGIASGPVAAPDGTVYVICAGRAFTLQALSRDGVPLWSIPIGDMYTWHGDHRLVLAPDGCLLIPTAGGLVRVDPCGAIADVMENARGDTVTVGPNGAVYVGTMDGLTAMSGDHAVLWVAGLDGHHAASPPAVARDGLVYAPTGGSSSGRGSPIGHGLAAIDAKGNRRWFVDLPDNWVACAASPKGGLVLAGALGIMALGPNGETCWRFGPPSECTALAVGGDGTVFAAARDTLYCLEANGEQRWTRSFKGYPWQGALAVGGNGAVYVRLDDQVFAAKGNKKLAWVVEFPDMGGDRRNWESQQLPATGVALAPGGRVYACSPKTLYAIRG